jgi:hypothetical protein
MQGPALVIHALLTSALIKFKNTLSAMKNTFLSLFYFVAGRIYRSMIQNTAGGMVQMIFDPLLSECNNPVTCC